ncbi:MAG TPA: helicase SNF2, partial [Microscillaceae bacterium]|nr:helicase SNF2 [Microscillaceae bacterium]
MAKKYGNTWWGQQWLSALNHIDYSNRLPRGKTYANKGLVMDVVIEENLVKSKVQGSEYYPYDQKFKLQKFTPSQKEDILDIITEDPFILSSLLNRELPQELLNILDKKNIALFPRHWRDINGTCSCPDWAVPCKHLAAVVYVIANEIDKNPFMVFLLRGLDVLVEIQKRGFNAQGDFRLPVTPLRKLLTTKSSSENYQFRPQLMSKIDFSTLPESRELVLKLLPEKPLFFHMGDFKEVLAKAYLKVAKGVKKLQGLPGDADYNFFEENQGEFTVFLDDTLEFRYVSLQIDHEEPQLPQNLRSVKDLMDNIHHINLAHLQNYHPSVVALYFSYQLALHLANKSAFIPELIEVTPKKYIIRWIPALIIQEVKTLCEVLSALIPPEMVVVRLGDNVKLVKPEEQVKMLVGVFIHQFLKDYYISTNDRHNSEDVFRVFFQQNILSIDGFVQKENAQAIQKWLQKFYLSEKQYQPVLKVEEREAIGGFELGFWVQNQRDTMQRLISIRDLFEKKKYNDIRLGIIQDLAILSEYLASIKQLIKAKGKTEILVDSEEFVQIFLYTLPALKLLNIQVMLPKALRRLARPQLSGKIGIEDNTGNRKSFVNLQSMLEFEWQVAIGNTMVSPQEFQKMVRKLKGIVKLNGEFVLIDQQEIERLLKRLENPPKITDNEVLRAGIAADYQGAKVSLDAKAQALIRSVMEFDTVASPKDLRATLRPYQQRGYEWLYKNTQLGFGSVLADDMGLGKTLQVISLLLKLKEEGKLTKKKALVVVPTTLLGNWQKEIQKFAPSLKATIYHGAQRKLDVKAPDVIITSYGIARSDVNLLSKQKWSFLAIDEAQNIKNTSTEQTKAIKKLKTERVVAMSGTPVENRLSEYWSIFDFVNKGYLGALSKFTDEYIKPIELERSQEHLERFRKVTAPFILRRVKTDKSIINDLPDKIVNDQICHLTTEQSALYQNVVDMVMKKIDDSKDIERKGLIFQLMNALKQICNHPSHYLKKDKVDPSHSGKMQMLLSLLDNIYENGEKTLIFTQYREMGDLL